MSTLYVTEYSRLAVEEAGQSVVVGMEPGLDGVVAISGSSASGVFKTSTRFVRVHTDVVCSLVFAAPNAPIPVATTLNKRLAAGQTEFFGVPPGGAQFAVISNI